MSLPRGELWGSIEDEFRGLPEAQKRKRRVVEEFLLREEAVNAAPIQIVALFLKYIPFRVLFDIKRTGLLNTYLARPRAWEAIFIVRYGKRVFSDALRTLTGNKLDFKHLCYVGDWVYSEPLKVLNVWDGAVAGGSTDRRHELRIALPSVAADDERGLNYSSFTLILRKYDQGAWALELKTLLSKVRGALDGAKYLEKIQSPLGQYDNNGPLATADNYIIAPADGFNNFDVCYMIVESLMQYGCKIIQYVGSDKRKMTSSFSADDDVALLDAPVKPDAPKCVRHKCFAKAVSLCGGCMSASYCSEICQKHDWTAGKHREYCRK